MLAVDDTHKVPLAELYRRYESNANGLTEQEARRRLEHHGPNELQARRRTPEFVKFLQQFRNFFAILLIGGGVLALLAERLDPDQGNFYIACALFGVVLLNASFTYLQERQSERIMESFRKMLPQMATVLRDGEAKRLPAANVVPGDVMLLGEGDRISADGRLIEQQQLKVDLSSLTGESEPQLRHLECTHENLLESRNMVFSGTLVQSGGGRALVYGTGMQTQIGWIVRLTKETEEAETPIRRELRHFIHIISTIAIALGVIFFGISVAIGKGTIASLIFAIGIIVANVPEGLLPTVTLSLTMASKRMARKKALIKHLESVETLGSTTVICTDKTGTLTENRIHARTVILNDDEFAAWDRRIRDEPGIDLAWQVMTYCNNVHRMGEGYTGDPTEFALLEYAETLRPIPEDRDSTRRNEYPFDSATKRMITVNDLPEVDGLTALLKGAPEVVLEKCASRMFRGESRELDDDTRQRIVADYRRLARRGERVLALAMCRQSHTRVEESGFTYVGLVGMLDPARPEVPGAIRLCRRAGIRVVMITGDYGLTAETIARQIGLIQGEGTVVRGDELALMDDITLARVLENEEIVFARTNPVQKLRIVRALQDLGHVVTVTGDGVNDAPALKNADMGVSMGIMGTDVAKEASDMILMDDNFATIVAAVEEGRTIFDNIKKFIAYILTSNIPEILPFIAYVVLDIPLPLTVVLILTIDLGTDIMPALGLGAERPETDVMSKAPRSPNERLLTGNLLFMSYAVIGMVQAGAGFFSYFVVLYTGGWRWGEDLASTEPLYRTAITAFFASIVICQIADVIICRTRRQSLFTVGFLSNRLILFGIATELALLAAIAYVPWLNILLGTAPLAYWHYLPSVPFAIAIVLGDELRRRFVRQGNPFVLEWLTW